MNLDRLREMPARREFVVMLVACVVAAGLAVYAASRTWLLETVERAAPIPDLITPRSGGSLAPALPALALVALAGSGALLATRGRARWLVGGLLVAAGVGVMITAAETLLGGELRGGPARPGWPMLCVFAGFMITVVGVVTLRRGSRWPSMGSRYERSTPRRRIDAVEDGAKSKSINAVGSGTLPQARLWDALDRGDDPTEDQETQKTT